MDFIYKKIIYILLLLISCSDAIVTSEDQIATKSHQTHKSLQPVANDNAL